MINMLTAEYLLDVLDGCGKNNTDAIKKYYLLGDMSRGDKSFNQEFLNKLIENYSDNLYAVNFIGIIYENGIGITASTELAITYYKKAADKGFVEAIHHLGRIYILIDKKQSVKWFLKAASYNHPDAMHDLGVLYTYGNGVKQNLQTATDYFTRAANAGCSMSMIRLMSSSHFDTATTNAFIRKYFIKSKVSCEHRNILLSFVSQDCSFEDKLMLFSHPDIDKIIKSDSLLKFTNETIKVFSAGVLKATLMEKKILPLNIIDHICSYI